jgi:dinuclear metal center YbgI/SA1388 family protein
VKLSEIYAVADGLAPKALSDEYCAKYGAYDNSGILVDTGEEIERVLFSLDLSFAAIEKAVQSGAKLIITHHPAIYGKISDISTNAFEPLGEKLITCIKNGISVLSMHLNLDSVKGGIDESLQEGVTAASHGKMVSAAIMHPLTDGGYGRAYSIQTITLKDLVKGMEKEFKTSKMVAYGDLNETIEKAASFCGSGADECAVEFAIKQGAQVLISSDFKHHVLALALEKGLSVIALTHYASENYGFEKYYEKMRQRLAVSCEYHTDTNLL